LAAIRFLNGSKTRVVLVERKENHEPERTLAVLSNYTNGGGTKMTKAVKFSTGAIFGKMAKELEFQGSG
jgi:hypothetical protein